MLMDHKNLNKPAKSIPACMHVYCTQLIFFTHEEFIRLLHLSGSGKKKNGKRQPATVTLHAAEVSRNNDEIKFQFSGHKLVCDTFCICSRQNYGLNIRTLHYFCAKSNKDGFFGKSDPFYIISKRREGTTDWVPCFTSGLYSWHDKLSRRVR